MSVVVFAGPTLSNAEIRTVLDHAVIRPPAARGDVYRAARAGARVIALIDGYFCQQPSVWHKELLWALANDLRVFGAGSMGALRAAELHCYGMIGVGDVFEAFRSGVLEDDDEVAIVHGPPESGYVACSEAMVDIRATLREAERCGVVARATALRLIAAAKALYYPYRSLEALMQGGLCEDAEIERLRAWLPAGRVQQKATDARRLLETIASELVAARPARPTEPIVFEETLHWQRLLQELAVD